MSLNMANKRDTNVLTPHDCERVFFLVSRASRSAVITNTIFSFSSSSSCCLNGQRPRPWQRCPRSPPKNKHFVCFFLFVETFSIMDFAAGGERSEYNDYAIVFFFFFYQSIQIDCIVTYRKRRRRVTVKWAIRLWHFTREKSYFECLLVIRYIWALLQYGFSAYLFAENSMVPLYIILSIPGLFWENKKVKRKEVVCIQQTTQPKPPPIQKKKALQLLT